MPESEFKHERVLIVGLGLIGGSLALALRRQGFARELVGVDGKVEEIEIALQRGAIHRGSQDLLAEVAKADVVVLAVPVKAMESLLEQIKPVLRPHTVLTDVGSTKGNIVAAAQRIFAPQMPAGFVPGHPIAGAERSGMAAADGQLFARHKVIITPLEHSASEAVAVVTAMWQAAGAEVLSMSVPHHDEVLAATSHLPHLLAFSLVDTLAHDHENRDIFRYAAGGFRDFTRIAASDPTMWHDVFLANRDAVLEVLDRFTAGLSTLREAVEQGDSLTMLGVFTRAKEAREHFSRILEGTAYAKPRKTSQGNHYLLQPGGHAQARLRVPGDKSISHRAIMLGSLAEGITEIEGFLEGEDSLATLQAFRDLGVVIEGPEQGRVKIHGVGLAGLQAPAGALYLGNSGTSMRLLAGILAAQAFDSELTGDASLSKRPMERVATPLLAMGAQIHTSAAGCPPLRIQGGQALTGIDYALPVASAQVKSALLLAGLYAQGTTLVRETHTTRDHTERMLQSFGYQIEQGPGWVSLQGGGRLQGAKIAVPGDISSAAFLMVAAAITPGSEVWLEHVGVNPTRLGVVHILRQMGADIELQHERLVGAEPVADICVRYAPLQGIDIDPQWVSLAIDEFPALFIAACCAQGVTRIQGAQELRFKESDRIQAMVEGLRQLGIEVEALADGALIQGRGHTEGCVFSGGKVHSRGDHRIAMSFSLAALRASAPISIEDCAPVATSFPHFPELIAKLGIQLSVKDSL